MSKAKSTHETSHKPDPKETGVQKTTERAPHPTEGAARRSSNLARRDPYAFSPFAGLSPFAPTSPFSFMRRFGEEMDRLFEDFGFGGMTQAATWSPQVEVFEREGKLVVRADLPGMKREDLKVDLEDDAITIQGERRREHEENREGFFRSERSYGSFSRTIPLPEGVNGENAKARFRDGVLEIELEAPTRKSGRRLDIEDAPETK